MQASKIDVGDTYAVRRHGTLMRFRVTEVTTHRGSSRSSTTSEVTGHLVDEENRLVTMEVSEVIGPYAEHAELAEKARKEREERERVAKEQKERAKRLVKLLFKRTGTRPSVNEYNSLFRCTYSHGVEISKEGVEALLKSLDKLTAEADLAHSAHLVE
jgi:hypothetical protein